MGIKGSFGLVVDLGRSNDDALKQVQNIIWQENTAFSEPASTYGELRGVPRITEGKVQLGDELSSACYTRFEQDKLGYEDPAKAPLLLTVSVTEYAQAHALLSNLARNIYGQVPFYAAMLGDLTSYYFNAELIGPEWLDFQQANVDMLLLSKHHPFYADFTSSEDLAVLEQGELTRFWSQDEMPDRQKRFRKVLTAFQEKSGPLNLGWD